MPDDLQTVSDLIADQFDVAPIEAQSILKASPLIDLLQVVPSSDGTNHKYPNYTGAPVVGFRAENAGRDLDSSQDTLVTIALKILDWSFEVDQAVAGAWRKGGKDAWIAREGMRSLKASLVAFEKQIFNGTAAVGGDSGGFVGLRQAATVDALADAMVVNAAGTTINTASSVWALRIAEDGVLGVFRGDGDAFELGETVAQKRIVNPGTDNKTLPTWYTPAWTWLGLQIGGAYDIGRIANLTQDSGKGLTDLLMSQLLEKFPIGYAPTHFLMSRRSLGQLQRSRTTYSPTGQPAPLPTEYQGIPIIATDAIFDTEPLVA